ncbi:MAG: TolC family protein [Candidatus Aminicenantes bacterium]|nr:TolC family protein [Candidatus Aminicenantes bacterium]
MKKAYCWLLVVFLINGAVFALDKDVQSMTLEEVIEQALKNNLDLQIEMANPQIFRALWRKSTAIFDPGLSLDFSTGENNSPSSSALTGADIETTKNSAFTLGVAQRLPFGGSLDVTLRSNRFETNSRYSSYNPRYNSILTFNLTQPLLKNFGSGSTQRSIRIARNNRDKSIFALRQAVINLIYQTEEAYWNLVYSHQNLEVKQKSLQLAKDLLRQNETQVKVGVSAPMDILTAQAEVAARESETLQAQSQIQTYEENLRRILNVSEMPATIIPQDKPLFVPITADFNEYLLEALEKRPDIEQVRLDLKNKNIDVHYYRNQLLPDLQLNATYYTSGLSGDQLIWDGNPLLPDSKIIDTIKGGFDDSLSEAFKNTYRNFSIGLQLSIPVLNTSARADMAQAKLNLKQSLLQLKKIESTIYSEVKQIVMDLETNLKIVEANRISRELAEQKLSAEQKKLAVGLSTNYLVLQYQRDFSNAQIAELKSLIDYNLALSRVNKVLGSTLEKHHIEFSDFLVK